MREGSLDEFESIFEQASIPVLDIDEVVLRRVDAVLVGGTVDASILSLAAYLEKRFRSEVTVHYPRGPDVDEMRDTAAQHGHDAAKEGFASTGDLIQFVRGSETDLVLLAAPTTAESGMARVDLDALVEETTPPVLIVQTAIEEPATVFTNVLHSLTGNFQQTQNFTYSFTLAEDGGALFLLHVISGGEVDAVRETLKVSPAIARQAGGALLGNLAHHGERYLKAIVAASRERPFDVRYRIALGDVVSTVRKELAAGNYSLIVVGSHHEGRSHVTSADYRLMHQLRNVPVLAL